MSIVRRNFYNYFKGLLFFLDLNHDRLLRPALMILSYTPWNPVMQICFHIFNQPPSNRLHPYNFSWVSSTLLKTYSISPTKWFEPASLSPVGTRPYGNPLFYLSLPCLVIPESIPSRPVETWHCRVSSAFLPPVIPELDPGIHAFPAFCHPIP